jgi:hypothetical protein
LVFALDPVGDNPRAVYRTTQKTQTKYGPVVDPAADSEDMSVTGACYTMLFSWVKADRRAEVTQRGQLPPSWSLGIMHHAYRRDVIDPAEEMGIEMVELGSAHATDFLDLLDVIMTCNPSSNAVYFGLGLSPFRMGGHIVGFKVTSTGGAYLDPASGLWRAKSRPDLLFGVREKIREYVDLMSIAKTVEVQLFGLD